MSQNNRANRKAKVAKRNKVTGIGKRDPNLLERSTMTQKIDATVVEALCRYLGRTDFDFDDALWARIVWVDYKPKTPKEENKFTIDGKELFIVRPWEWSIPHNAWGRRVDWLFDKENYVHHTKEDEKG